MMDLRTTTRQRPCKHCNKAGRCRFVDGDDFSICFRPDEATDLANGVLKEGRNGPYLQYYSGTKKQRGRVAEKQPTPARPERPSDDTCDPLYRWLIDQPELALTSFWHDNLVRRGLTLEAVRAGLYRRMPNKGEQRRVLRRALERFPDADQIPGVSRLGSYQNGSLLIPVCNIVGQIIALKLRLAEPIDGQKYAYFSGGKGPSSGSPYHVPPGTPGRADLVRIVEGELKAHISGLQTEIPSISFPGCSQWSVCIPALKALSAKTVRVCFDADVRENPSVAAGLLACVQGLQAAGFSVQAERWDPDHGKGVDDALIAGHADHIEVLDAESSLVWAMQCVEQTRPPGSIPSGASDGGDASDESDGGRKANATVEHAFDHPFRLAQEFLDTRGASRVVYWREQFYEFDGLIYRVFPGDELTNLVRSHIHCQFIEAARQKAKEKAGAGNKDCGAEVKNVTDSCVRNVIGALRSLAGIRNAEPPCWLGSIATIPADEILVTRSGLVHITDLQGGIRIEPLSPDLFNQVAIPHPIEPQARCPAWLAFLDSVWPEDYESQRALRQFFGYCLLSTNKLHKMLVILGPTRSGKSVISSVLRELIGKSNACSPTLSDLAEGFRLQSLLGKRLAVIPEARLGKRADGIKILERLLAIVGGDGMLIDRKFREPLPDVELPIRFVIHTNELPSFDDASAALASRMLLLQTKISFQGREDRTLSDRIRGELPGVLLWALGGLSDLQETGEFIQPVTGRETLLEWQGGNNPVLLFVNACCELGPDCQIETERLYARYVAWCEATGHHPLADNRFGMKLHATVADVLKSRLSGQGRPWGYRGITIRPAHTASV